MCQTNGCTVTAVCLLKSGKAAGICGIPAELLKAGGEPIARGLHSVLAAIWRSDRILALRVFVERRREFGRGLLAAYIDLKKCVPNRLWDLLGEDVRSVRACGEDIEVTKSFSYLSSAVHNSGLSDQEVNRRIGLAAGVMNSLDKSIWRCGYLSRRTKLLVVRALIMPVLVYGSETWTLSSALVSRLDDFCNRSLRWIMGCCWQTMCPTNGCTVRLA
ncbi:uncharacterized protein [Penaeus vannamei]|uniref:uncharacterized protein n=1 Tax=Penaeus vannamei TaxID=6689 RepID=UPI00387F785A